jgi:hypothetical protein
MNVLLPKAVLVRLALAQAGAQLRPFIAGLADLGFEVT